MSDFSSPLRFAPPISPRRVPSPIMSPNGRRGRAVNSSEDSHLRDLSPDTTLRAFTEKPLPFDTGRDEYKIFECIDGLTAAERDLGSRVAKAAQRLKSWCEEIGQWGWSGSFEPPSDDYMKARRKSLEMRVREHVPDPAAIENVKPLVYWGSLLSEEVQAHEMRLDEIDDELLRLDVEELKEHVLDIHGPNRSRPSSAGLGASRAYTPMDDFSFLITHTLLSALPDHVELKGRLNTWVARLSVLRAAPKYLAELQMARKSMELSWKAIEMPKNPSDDAAFNEWKEAADIISPILQGRVSKLGRQLDTMLDTLEGRADCLPENWIDTFETVEADLGRWTHEHRTRLIEMEVRRRAEGRMSPVKPKPGAASGPAMHSDDRAISPTSPAPAVAKDTDVQDATPLNTHFRSNSVSTAASSKKSNLQAETVLSSQEVWRVATAEVDLEPPAQADIEDDFVFVEDDTVVHDESDTLDEVPTHTPGQIQIISPDADSDGPVIIHTEEKSDEEGTIERPQTPTSRRSSIASISTSISSSSPPSFVEESPSVRNATNRQARAPKPELNAAMRKRRAAQASKVAAVDATPDSIPWPPSQFSRVPPANSSEDLERKISDILTTIPANIRLTSQNGAAVDPIRPKRPGIANKSSKGLLRAARSMQGMKSPELTLSPAKHDADSANAASGRKSAAAMRADNDIKLYHLTRPGYDAPMKLFIRRVGEADRVMVRVGGGWSDLGEFLRNYAEHHGRRVVSDGKFEILGLGADATDTPRSESVMSKRERRFSGGSAIGARSANTTPQKAVGRNVAQDEPPPPMPNFTPTQGTASGETSAPSTGSSRHSWTGNEIGLAGTKAKKHELGEKESEWVEGMMKQARSVSSGNMINPTSVPRSNTASAQPREGATSRSGADSRSENRTKSTNAARKPDFGDLGKAGGTKRIFFKKGDLSEK